MDAEEVDALGRGIVDVTLDLTLPLNLDVGTDFNRSGLIAGLGGVTNVVVECKRLSERCSGLRTIGGGKSVEREVEREDGRSPRDRRDADLEKDMLGSSVSRYR